MSDLPEPARANSIRIPNALEEWLRERAIANRRSFSGEVVFRLEQSQQAELRQARREGDVDPPPTQPGPL